MTGAEVLASLRRQGSTKALDGMARYGIVAKRAFGVPMNALIRMRKEIGTDQALSLELWESGWYEARLLAALIGDPARVTKKQMNAWAAGFENWADCDTACFKLFDKTPHAFERARAWIRSPKEFVKRGGFVLVACLSTHDKTSPDSRFAPFLPLIEKEAGDERNFVTKGISWALRGIGRRSPGLRKPALAVAKRLAASDAKPSRWIGKDAARDLAKH